MSTTVRGITSGSVGSFAIRHPWRHPPIPRGRPRRHRKVERGHHPAPGLPPRVGIYGSDLAVTIEVTEETDDRHQGLLAWQRGAETVSASH